MVVNDKNNPKESIVKLNTNPLGGRISLSVGTSPLHEESQAPAGLAGSSCPSQIGGEKGKNES